MIGLKKYVMGIMISRKRKQFFFSVDKKCSSADTVKRQGKILGQIEFVSIVKYVATETALKTLQIYISLYFI